MQEALDALIKRCGITVLVVAHRLSTIRTANTIAVVQEGAVVEKGTHDELLAMHGLYMNEVMSS